MPTLVELDMDRSKLLLIILGALAAGATIAAVYLTQTWYGRFLTILGAVVLIVNAPLDATVGATIGQAIIHVLNCST